MTLAVAAASLFLALAPFGAALPGADPVAPIAAKVVAAPAAHKLPPGQAGGTVRLTQPVDAVDIEAAMSDPTLTIELRGSGIDYVTVRMSGSPRKGRVRIPAGTYLKSSESGFQDMVVTRDTFVDLSLTRDTWNQVPAACASAYDKVPTSDVHFSLGDRPELRPLRLGQVSPSVAQAATWIVTNDFDYDQLGRLVAGFGRARVINGCDAVAAMKLVADSGLDVQRRSIWRRHRYGLLLMLLLDCEGREETGTLFPWLVEDLGLSDSDMFDVVLTSIGSPSGPYVQPDRVATILAPLAAKRTAALIAVLNQKDIGKKSPNLRIVAARVLADLNEVSAVPALVNALTHLKKRPGDTHGSEGSAIVKAIGHLADNAVIPVLRRQVTHKWFGEDARSAIQQIEARKGER